MVFVTTDEQGNIQYTTADGTEYDPSANEQSEQGKCYRGIAQ